MGRILIIDDEPDLRSLLRDFLEPIGHHIEEAPTGDEGISVMRKSPIDLVITDIFMPDKDGIETILHLREAYPDVKIIAISGGGRVGTRDALDSALEFGAQRVFTKPLDGKKIVKAINDLID